MFFAYHVVLLMVSVIGSLTARSKDDACEFETAFLAAVLSSAVVFFASSMIIMITTLYFSLKYAHFGSNLVWFLMWLFGGSC